MPRPRLTSPRKNNRGSCSLRGVEKDDRSFQLLQGDGREGGGATIRPAASLSRRRKIAARDPPHHCCIPTTVYSCKRVLKQQIITYIGIHRRIKNINAPGDLKSSMSNTRAPSSYFEQSRPVVMKPPRPYASDRRSI